MPAQVEMPRARGKGMRGNSSRAIASIASRTVLGVSEDRSGIGRIAGPSVAKATEPKKTRSANQKARLRITPTTAADTEGQGSRETRLRGDKFDVGRAGEYPKKAGREYGPERQERGRQG